jgi:hypothetical protein
MVTIAIYPESLLEEESRQTTPVTQPTDVLQPHSKPRSNFNSI